MIWKDSIGKGILVSTAKAFSKRTRNLSYKYVVPIVIVELGISFKKKFRLYNTQSITYLMNSSKWRTGFIYMSLLYFPEIVHL